MAVGRLFLAATGKARSPRVDRCTDGTTSVTVLANRKRVDDHTCYRAEDSPLGANAVGPKIEAEGREREWGFLGRGQLGGMVTMVSALNSPAGFGAEHRPPKDFPLFLALSPDTIILLIVNYHVATREPRLLYAPDISG